MPIRFCARWWPPRRPRLHLRQVLGAARDHDLGTTLEENLAMIARQRRVPEADGREVIYDAEHFFDGFRPIPTTRWRPLKAAATRAPTGSPSATPTAAPSRRHRRGGAGGARRRADPARHPHPQRQRRRGGQRAGRRRSRLHSGSGNHQRLGRTLRQRQPHLHHPDLQLKMDRRCVPDENLARLTELSRTVSEIANIRPRAHAPFVGQSAFAHKGGMHVAAVEKLPPATSTSRPSGLATGGTSSSPSFRDAGMCACARSSSESTCRGPRRRVLERIKELESQGYQFEAAEGSFELLGRRSQARLHRRPSRCWTWS